ncbi:MAG: ATP-dependent DNA helicase RecQ [Maribacter sp.]
MQKRNTFQLDKKTEILKQYWGYDSFRSMQGEIIDSVLSGKDTLALMPTGGGKSICFQVPALVKEGVAIVISPLIALMKDQVSNLKKRGITAEAIFSGMHYRDIDRILDNAAYGGLKFLYLSPERLTTEIVRERIKKMNVNVLAVDEAHCISQWGYDFRPPYLKIAEIRELLPNTPIIAVTATATKQVAIDIQEKLEFKDGIMFQKSFSRSNLSYSVLHEHNKTVKLLDILKRIRSSAVVYARNRRQTKEVANYLVQKGISASCYHAGLESDERSKRQDAWINNKIRVMVSTNAFGMGIDKPDVRVVVHLDLPDNLEAYFQEAGRAGRDGRKAFAVLLYNEKDKIMLEKHYKQGFPSFDEVRKVWQALGSYYQLAIGGGIGESYDFDLVEFSNNYKFEVVKTYNCLKMLEQNGWVTLSDAVHMPPSITFIMKKEVLYDYQLKNKRLDKVIRRILQSYQGGYGQVMQIREFSKLAYSLKMNAEQLDILLQKLDHEEVLEYLPAKDKPQLTFLREKVGVNNLDFDISLYNFRKERQKERMAKAIAYAEYPVCRSQQLLSYFGEKLKDKCGICDVCTGRNSSGMTADEFNRLQDKVSRLLKKEQLNTAEILDSFAPKYEKKLLKVLDYMYSEEIISKGKNGELLLN